MPIYTRRGDLGKTQVIGSTRRLKDDARVGAYGSVDEAGAVIGSVIAFVATDTAVSDVAEVLIAVQQMLWDVGADLARVDDKKHSYRTPDTAATQLEPIIDRYQGELPPLTQFILRGGVPRVVHSFTWRVPWCAALSATLSTCNAWRRFIPLCSHTSIVFQTYSLYWREC